jgi:hypothetical protein
VDTSADGPFESLESSYEYIRLLHEVLADTQEAIDGEIVRAGDRPSRRIEAFRVVAYKLHQLDDHLRGCRRLLNDLRTLRRLLLHERDERVEPQVAMEEVDA